MSRTSALSVWCSGTPEERACPSGSCVLTTLSLFYRARALNPEDTLGVGFCSSLNACLFLPGIPIPLPACSSLRSDPTVTLMQSRGRFLWSPPQGSGCEASSWTDPSASAWVQPAVSTQTTRDFPVPIFPQQTVQEKHIETIYLAVECFF